MQMPSFPPFLSQSQNSSGLEGDGLIEPESKGKGIAS